MNHILDTKKVLSNADMTVDNGSFTFTAVNTEGYDYAVVDFIFGDIPANVTAAKVQECDTSGGQYTDISGATLDGGTNTDGTTAALPTAASGDSKIYSIEMSLAGRMKYLKPVLTAGDGAGSYGFTECAVVVTLSRASEAPTSLTARGLAACIRL